jgi:AhpD family alkylhydroperoxidase
MSRLRLLAREDAPVTVRPLYRADGEASPLLRALAHAPDLLETLWPLVLYTSDDGALDLPTKELIVVRVSQLHGSAYCLSEHVPYALELGVPEEHVAAACDTAPRDVLPPREQALLDWVDAFVRDPAAIDDALVMRLREHLREDQLLELCALVGVTELLNKISLAFDLPPHR